jgi:hypothetical protein
VLCRWRSTACAASSGEAPVMKSRRHSRCGIVPSRPASGSTERARHVA